MVTIDFLNGLARTSLLHIKNNMELQYLLSNAFRLSCVKQQTSFMTFTPWPWIDLRVPINILLGHSNHAFKQKQHNVFLFIIVLYHHLHYEWVVSSYHCFSLIFHQLWRWAYINIKNPCLEFSIKYLETLSNVY
jgi:hypothetical protein